MKQKQRGKQLKADLPAIFLCLKGNGFACAFSPMDLIPALISAHGYLDGYYSAPPALIALTIRLIPQDVFRICRKEAEETRANGNP